MTDIPPSNVVNLNDYKRHKLEQQEINALQSFELSATGQLNFDSLDELIEALEEQGLTVDAYIYPDEEQPVRAND